MSLISPVLMSGMKVKLKKPPSVSHARGNISVMPECSNQRTSELRELKPMKNESLLLLCFCATRFTAVAALHWHSKVCLLTCYVTDVIVITDTDESLAKNKSNFFPPRNRNITLDNYIHFLTKFPLEELQVKDIKGSSLTKEEQNALFGWQRPSEKSSRFDK